MHLINYNMSDTVKALVPLKKSINNHVEKHELMNLKSIQKAKCCVSATFRTGILAPCFVYQLTLDYLTLNRR